MQKTVTLILKSEDDNYILGKRKDTKMWTFVGGGIEEGEEPLQAMAREAREEIGYVFSHNDLTLLQVKETPTLLLYIYGAILPVSKNVLNFSFDPDEEFCEIEEFGLSDIMDEDFKLHISHNRNFVIELLKSDFNLDSIAKPIAKIAEIIKNRIMLSKENNKMFWNKMFKQKNSKKAESEITLDSLGTMERIKLGNELSKVYQQLQDTSIKAMERIKLGKQFADIYVKLGGAEVTNQTNAEVNNQSNSEVVKYRYGMKSRPFSLGTQPDGQIDVEDEQTVDGVKYFNVVVYDHPLTAEEIKKYELVDLQSSEANQTKEEGKLQEQINSIIEKCQKIMDKKKKLSLSDLAFFDKNMTIGERSRTVTDIIDGEIKKGNQKAIELEANANGVSKLFQELLGAMDKDSIQADDVKTENLQEFFERAFVDRTPNAKHDTDRKEKAIIKIREMIAHDSKIRDIVESIISSINSDSIEDIKEKLYSDLDN